MNIDYRKLSDKDRLDLLKLLYHDAKVAGKDVSLVVEEAQLVLKRLRGDTLNSN